MAKTVKVAVLLTGSGHMDGSEIRESVLALLALDQHGAMAQCIAPNAPQVQVFDHATRHLENGGPRNMLEESSRIARAGQCLDLAKAEASDYDALVIPGGLGVAKNACSWAFSGVDAQVRPDVATFVKAFFTLKRPVGAICIAPALVALCLAMEKKRATLTMGDGGEIQTAMEQLGHTYRSVPSAREVVVDEDLKLVTTSAYMFGDAALSDIWIGIERCVTEVLERV